MKRLKIPKDLQELYRLALKQKWTITVTKANHLKWMAPSGVVVFTPSSPSDHRGRDNTRRDLRRAGLRIERG